MVYDWLVFYFGEGLIWKYGFCFLLNIVLWDYFFFGLLIVVFVL